MSEHRRPSDSPPVPGENRPRPRSKPRSLVACGACRKRRSKCEPRPEDGGSCLRCYQLRTECSFLPGTGRVARRPRWSTNSPPVNGLVPLSSGADPDPNNISGSSHGVANGVYHQRRDVAGFRASLGPPSTGPVSHSTVSPQSHLDCGVANVAEPVSETVALRAQVDRLQRELASLRANQDPVAASVGSDDGLDISGRRPGPAIGCRPPSRGDAHGGVRQAAVDYRGATDPEAFSLVNRGMGEISERGLRDPVSEGIVDLGQLEAAYQVFKHQCSTILPYPSLLTTRSRAPSHPFLRSAFLVYASRCSIYKALFTEVQVRQLENNVALNLMAFHRGCPPSLESVYAALILSLLPPGNDPLTLMSDFDPARMVGMAYGQIREMGHSVFMERLVKSLEDKVPLAHLKESLDKARLHFCIMARVSWTNMSRCPINDLPTSLGTPHVRLLEILHERNEACELDRQLKFETESLRILTRQWQGWRELEQVLTPSVSELRKGNRVTRQAVSETSALRTQLWREGRDLIALPWISAQMTYSKWWMAIRNVWFSYRLPSPVVVPDLQTEWLEGLELAAVASEDMITRCLQEEWDLGVFPRALGVALVLCYHSLSMGATHLRHYHPGVPLPPSLDISDRLDRLQVALKTSPISLRTMLSRAQATLDEYRRQLASQSLRQSRHGSPSKEDAHSHEHPFSGVGNGINVPNGIFDFEMPLDFTFGGMGGVEGNAGGSSAFDPFSQPGFDLTGASAMGMGVWDPLMSFGNVGDWQHPDGSGRPFWDR